MKPKSLKDNYDEMRKFQATLNYPGILMMRINDLDNAIQRGYDGTVQLTGLVSKLTDEIYAPIKPRVMEVTDRLEKTIHGVISQPKPDAWSSRHWMQHVDMEAKKHNREAMQEIENIIINRLFELGLLIEQEKKIPSGFEGTITRQATKKTIPSNRHKRVA